MKAESGLHSQNAMNSPNLCSVDLFTDEYQQTVGIGESPNLAYADLCKKNGIETE